jgi:type IV fimbrial biogenesis protein FimT
MVTRSVRSPFHGGTRRDNGFTLIELMVVLSILAIFATLAAPSMVSLIATQRVRSAAGDLQLTLMKARSEAIKRNTSVSVVRTGANWNSGWTIADPAGSSTALYTVNLPSGVSVSDSPANSQVVYGPNGRASVVASFVLAATSATTSRCVAIDLTGRPYIKDGSTC